MQADQNKQIKELRAMNNCLLDMVVNKNTGTTITAIAPAVPDITDDHIMQVRHTYGLELAKVRTVWRAYEMEEKGLGSMMASDIEENTKNIRQDEKKIAKDFIYTKDNATGKKLSNLEGYKKEMRKQIEILKNRVVYAKEMKKITEDGRALELINKSIRKLTINMLNNPLAFSRNLGTTIKLKRIKYSQTQTGSGKPGESRSGMARPKC